jgi:hypothetical protein
MRTIFAALLVAASLGGFQCKLPTASDTSGIISSLHFTPSAFDSFRRNSEMKYSLKVASIVSSSIVRRDSAYREQLVKTLAENLNETTGAHSITWIGDTDQHLFAPAGIYFGVVRIQNLRFETIIQVFHF